MAFLDNTGLERLWSKITSKLSGKVDKVDGKGLSTNDYTTDEKNKLAGIATGANKTVVDSALSSTSTNPVQNKVVNTAISSLNTLVGDTAVSTQISNATDDCITGLSVSGTTVTYTKKGGATGTITTQDTNTTYSDMKGATSSAAGTHGLVPAPAAGKQGQYLRGDGTWATPTNTTYGVATTSANGLMSSTDKTKLDGIETGANKTVVDSALSSSSTNPVQNKVVNTAITNLNTLVGDTAVATQISNYAAPKSHTHAYIPTSQKGAANGVAELDSNGKVPAAQLPSYVDDVLEGYYSSSKFYTTKGSDGTYSGEITGETGKIYVDLNTNKTYRWSGSAYTVISETLALGTTSSTAFRGDYGNTAYAHATAKGSAFSSGLYKITTNAQGHVTAATAVAKSDITGLGIPAQDTTYSAATTSAAGLMSAADKTKLDGIATGANKTTVDSALSSTSTNPVQNKVVNTAISDLSTLVGDTSVASQIASAKDECITGLSVSGRTVTYTKGDGSTGTITTQDTNTTYSNATTSAAGLMSKDDKAKLDGITASADSVSYTASATSGNKVGTITINGTATDMYSPTQTSVSGNAGTATKWATARNINGMSVQGDANRFNYGSCSTEAATAAKVVSCAGFALATGSEITVKFTVTNTAASPTLNVNGTGAKAIYYRGAAISAGYLAANRTYTFRYNGTQYDLVGDLDTNTSNTTGTTNKTGTKLFLAGATSQGNNPVTYSNSSVYIDTDNCLYSNGAKVATAASVTAVSNLVGDTSVATQIENYAAPKSHSHSAYVNQNAFSNVVVGSTTVAADSATDTLTLAAGSNITLTPDATNDKITIAVSGITAITSDQIDTICV